MNLSLVGALLFQDKNDGIVLTHSRPMYFFQKFLYLKNNYGVAIFTPSSPEFVFSGFFITSR